MYEEKIKAMEYLYDWLDSGESFEGLAIRIDIVCAGLGKGKAHDDIWRGALKCIRRARAQGAGRNEVMTYLKNLKRSLTNEH